MLNNMQEIADRHSYKTAGRVWGDKQAQKPMEHINVRGRDKFDKMADAIKALKIDAKTAIKNLRKGWTKHGR